MILIRIWCRGDVHWSDGDGPEHAPLGKGSIKITLNSPRYNDGSEENGTERLGSDQ